MDTINSVTHYFADSEI